MLYIHIYIYIYITRLASNEIFSPSNKIHRKVGRAKDLSAPRYCTENYYTDMFSGTGSEVGFFLYISVY